MSFRYVEAGQSEQGRIGVLRSDGERIASASQRPKQRPARVDGRLHFT